MHSDLHGLHHKHSIRFNTNTFGSTKVLSRDPTSPPTSTNKPTASLPNTVSHI